MGLQCWAGGGATVSLAAAGALRLVDIMGLAGTDGCGSVSSSSLNDAGYCVSVLGMCPQSALNLYRETGKNRGSIERLRDDPSHYRSRSWNISTAFSICWRREPERIPPSPLSSLVSLANETCAQRRSPRVQGIRAPGRGAATPPAVRRRRRSPRVNPPSSFLSEMHFSFLSAVDGRGTPIR